MSRERAVSCPRWFVVVLGVFAGTKTASGQQNQKLNAPLTAPPFLAGEVEDARLTPDGQRIVYVASQDSHDVAELYIAPLDGSAPPVKLSGDLDADEEIWSFEISPDGGWVAYCADQDQDDREIFAAPTDGSRLAVKLHDGDGGIRITKSNLVVFYSEGRLWAAPADGSYAALEISGPIDEGATVYQFELAPDSSRVVFSARQGPQQPYELFSAVLDRGVGRPGGAGHRAIFPRPRVVKLSGALSVVDGFRISPDSRRVVYQAGPRFSLFSVPIAGGTAVTVNGPLVPNGRVAHPGGFAISPDSQRVVYRADQETLYVIEIFSAPIDGSSVATKLNAPLPINRQIGSFAISPDSSQVVYLGSQETAEVDLIAAPIDGSAAPRKLYDRDPEEGYTWGGFQFTPDSRRVVFETRSYEEDTPPRTCTFYLRSVALETSDGAPGRALQLNGSHVSTFDESEDLFFSFRISPDGRRVVYLADEDTDDVFELYSARLDVVETGTGNLRRAPLERRVKLNRPLPERGQVGDLEEDGFFFDITPDGRSVIYRATQDDPFRYELYRVPIDRSLAPAQIHPELALGLPPGNVAAFEVTPDASRVVYRADQETDGVEELYAVPSDASSAPVKLSDSAGHGSVAEFAIAQNGTSVAYLAGQGSMKALFSAPIDGGAGPFELNAGGIVTDFEISSSTGRAVYVANQDDVNDFELFSAPLDGSAPAVRLNAVLPPGGDVSWYPQPVRVSADGTRAVYRADQDIDEVYELYSVLVDGSAPPVKLNGTLVAGTDTSSAVLSPDGAHVVYPASQVAAGMSELYSVPIGGGVPTQIVAPFPTTRHVFNVQVSPDSQRVAFTSDLETDERAEVYSVPIDGSASPIKLNGPMLAQSDVIDFAVSSDSAWLVFAADPTSDNRYEVFRAPLDGSATAVRLSLPLTGDQSARVFQISADGERVVYLSTNFYVNELFGVPIDGSAQAVRLHEPLPVGVYDFQIAPGGRHVTYRTSQTGQPNDLFRVSIEGGSSQPVNAPLEHGSVRASTIGSDGRVFYLADQDVAGIVELYATTFGRTAAPRPAPTTTVVR